MADGHQKAACRDETTASKPPKEVIVLTDDYSLLITGLVAAVVLWFVFTVIRKLFGVALLVALAVGAWMVWNDPALLQDAADTVLGFFGN